MDKDREPKAKKAPQRTPGYYYTLLLTVISSALFLISVTAYLLVGPPLQDLVSKLALVLFIAALVIGTHHVWEYRINKHL